MNFICGDRFVELADFVYTVPNPTDYYKYPNTFDPVRVNAFNGIPVIYTLTQYAKLLLPQLATLKKKVVLITHSSDDPVDAQLYAMLPPNVIRWFSQNVDHMADRLHAIPIGIENAQRAEFHHTNKPEKLLAKMKEEKMYKNLLYLNCSAWTNKTARIPLYQILTGNPWVTLVQQPNIFDFDGYIDNIYGHKFVACPPGNGIDTHRTWETLYLDSIPIEKRNENNIFWRDLPICFVSVWEEITEEFLNAEYERIINTAWNLTKLEFPYWRDLIKSYTL